MIAAMMGGGAPPMPEEAPVEEEVAAEEEKDNVEETDTEARLGVLEDMMVALFQQLGMPIPDQAGAGVPPEEAPPTELPPVPGAAGDAAMDVAPGQDALMMPPDFDMAAGLKEANLKQQKEAARQERKQELANKLDMLKKYSR
jgi:hypothetical protein